MADKKYASITAITELWAKIKALIPTKVSDLTNDSGFLSTESDPVFTASAAAGISAADISSWNAKISDDQTWNGVTLNKSQAASNDNYYLPALIGSVSVTSSRPVLATTSPTNNAIPKYTTDKTLRTSTPVIDADSANKGYVDGLWTSTKITNTLGYTPYNGTTNPNGYLTLATLPVYDGGVH